VLTPERWDQLKTLFDSALELEPSRRAAFLRDACAGDEALRAEVAAMIARYDRSPGFLETSALEVEARGLARDLELHGSRLLHDLPDAPAPQQPSAAARREQRAPWWLWLLAVVFVFDCLLQTWCRVAGPEPLGVYTQAVPGPPVVASLHPGSAAERAGLEPGDVLIAMDGQTFVDRSDLRAVAANLETDASYAFDIERGGQPRRASVSIGRMGFLADPALRIHALWQLNALLLLGTGLLIAFRRPRDINARLGALALATLSVGLYFTNLPRGYAAIWRDLPMAAGALLWIPNLCVYLVGPIVFTFFASFPRPLFRSRWPWLLVWLPALAFVPTFAAEAYHIVYQPERVFGSLPPARTMLAGVALFGLYGLASVAALAVNYSRITDLTERRRLRVLLLGGAVATVPSLLRFLVWSIFPDSALARALNEGFGDYLLALLFVLFPVLFAYSILRHRLFDIRIIVRQGLQYAMARGALVSVVPLLGIVLLADLLLHGDEPLLAIVEARGWVYAALGLTAMGAHSLRRRWSDSLDRRFFREQYDTRRLLLDVAEQTVQARVFDDATPAVIESIENALHPEFVAVIRRQRHDTVFLTAASTRADPGLLPLIADGALVTKLREATAPLRLAQDDGDLRPLALSEHERDFLERSRSELLVPIAMAPAPDEAVLVLGPKRSEQPYTREDVNLLAAIAANLGVLLARPQATHDEVKDEFTECPRCGLCEDVGTGRCPADGTELVPVRMLRTLAGRYHLERRLGRGGMGSVYEATDRALGRRVAVKLIREDRLDDSDVAQRFRNEAQAAASLSGVNVVTVYDYGVEAARRAYIVMELLHGRTLREEIAAVERLDAAHVVKVFRGVCAAVQGAHGQRLIHRDLKPENIFLAREGDDGDVVKVLDFGIAKFLSLQDAVSSRAMGETRVGMLVGTPNYLSPEQLLGEPSDVHSDIWALAVMAYECLTGTLPFPVGKHDAWRRAVLSGSYTALDEHLADAPERWVTLFADCLSLDRSKRPQTASEFLGRLEQALG